MTNTEILTWATLKTDTPFNEFFPDGRVPIVSPISIQPVDELAPFCYLVDGSKLSFSQAQGLANQLWQKWHPECESLEEAIHYIQEGLPLDCNWFIGVTTIDQKMLAILLDDNDVLTGDAGVEVELWEGQQKREGDRDGC